MILSLSELSVKVSEMSRKDINEDQTLEIIHQGKVRSFMGHLEFISDSFDNYLYTRDSILNKSLLYYYLDEFKDVNKEQLKRDKKISDIYHRYRKYYEYTIIVRDTIYFLNSDISNYIHFNLYGDYSLNKVQNYKTVVFLNHLHPHKKNTINYL